MDEAQFNAEFLAEAREDYRRASQVMADFHRFVHDAGGWNKCEMDPCHSVGVLMGDLAILLMGSNSPAGEAV